MYTYVCIWTSQGQWLCKTVDARKRSLVLRESS